jgi:hypothetical protein
MVILFIMNLLIYFHLSFLFLYFIVGRVVDRCRIVEEFLNRSDEKNTSVDYTAFTLLVRKLVQKSIQTS